MCTRGSPSRAARSLVCTLLALLVRYKSTNSDEHLGLAKPRSLVRCRVEQALRTARRQFTCFTGTRVQILTLQGRAGIEDRSKALDVEHAKLVTSMRAAVRAPFAAAPGSAKELLRAVAAS